MLTMNKKQQTKGPIQKDMIIMDVLKKYPDLFPVFFGHGIGCAGCGAAQFETIEQGVTLHGIDPDAFVTVLNEYIAKDQTE